MSANKHNISLFPPLQFTSCVVMNKASPPSPAPPTKSLGSLDEEGMEGIDGEFSDLIESSGMLCRRLTLV